ncbi:MAG: hypothetical protein A2901_03265 [Elusimicrobia bacterium RIFCSPLOWO2_01_FULL_54_10]|nr:MAG: hypothetical protein A2901_03265 [Elusimicrobia bacterium RIFCSPLOWO2_01_FULL_54_10]
MNDPNLPKPQGQIQIEIDEPTAQGTYSNLALITHSETEMILDFIFLQPQVPKAKVRSRIITSPAHAKKILLALEDNLKKYEARFGKINIQTPLDGDNKIGFYH